MKTTPCLRFVATMLAVTMIALPASAKEPAKGKSLFDGKTLDGWNGDPKFWRAEGGAIVGQTTKETPTKGNTFII
ncbi:MAG: hypothetical protein VCA36_07320, partial [Opitutales bacterium]